MRLKNAEIAVIAATLLFVVLTLGVCLQRGSMPAQVTVRTSAAEHTAPLSSRDGLVNINTATAAELCTLRGIGEKLAQRIIAYRQENGPFSCIEDLTRVRGIGSEIFSGLRDGICVE